VSLWVELCVLATHADALEGCVCVNRVELAPHRTQRVGSTAARSLHQQTHKTKQTKLLLSREVQQSSPLDLSIARRWVSAPPHASTGHLLAGVAGDVEQLREWITLIHMEEAHESVADIGDGMLSEDELYRRFLEEELEHDAGDRPVSVS
jgi:hypothetical protein